MEIITHSESAHLCAELKTGILAMLTDMGGLGTSIDSCSPLLSYLLL
jgi:hypothetical protein